MRQRLGGYLQYFKSIHAKLKKERIVQVQLSQAMIYNAVRVRSFPTKLQVDTCKSKEDRSAQAQLHTL